MKFWAKYVTSVTAPPGARVNSFDYNLRSEGDGGEGGCENQKGVGT